MSGRALAFLLGMMLILGAAIEYILANLPKPHKQLQFHEMSTNERNQCPEKYVDHRKSMMRCTLPDDGSFIRGEQ